MISIIVLFRKNVQLAGKVRIMSRSNFLSILLTLFIATMLISCDDDDNNPCARGEGNIVAETRTIPVFHSIDLRDIGNVFLTQGAPQEFIIETHENLLDIIETEEMDQILEIDLAQCVTGNLAQLDYTAVIEEIRELRLAGEGNITGQNDFNLDDLILDMTGVGNITVSGTVDDLRVFSTGVGNVSAFDLSADTVDVFVSGLGNVEVTANDALNVTITGTANVFYKGNPSITTNITGTGNLIDAN